MSSELLMLIAHRKLYCYLQWIPTFDSLYYWSSLLLWATIYLLIMIQWMEWWNWLQICIGKR